MNVKLKFKYWMTLGRYIYAVEVTDNDPTAWTCLIGIVKDA